MSFEQPALFERKPEDLTFEDFKALWDYPHKSPLPDPDIEGSDLYYEFKDAITWSWSKEPREVDGLGSFAQITEWNHGDGHEMGFVAQHVETGIIIMGTGTYSSWDSSEWDTIVEAEPFEFRETRYREVTK